MKPLAVTLGEPAGIGAEIAIAAWTERAANGLPPFYLVGDPDYLVRRARRIGTRLPVHDVAPRDAGAVFQDALPVVPLDIDVPDNPGKPQVSTAGAVVASIERAVEDALSGQAAAVVTLPIAKKPLYDAGFAFPGHTEFLGHLAELRGLPANPVMMLAGPDLRTVPVTIHVPLTEVPRLLTGERIEAVARIVASELRGRFGMERPRLAVAGLNPHAGEGGAMGREDEEIVRPAVERLAAEGIDVIGPLPADTMFHPRARASYDAAICMYHDQALIPAKTLAFDEAVNVTLGLPFIRTSPDHGTAFDIAGKGVARQQSFVAALRLARVMADRSAATAAA